MTRSYALASKQFLEVAMVEFDEVAVTSLDDVPRTAGVQQRVVHVHVTHVTAMTSSFAWRLESAEQPPAPPH